MAPQSVPDAAAISPYPFVVRQERAGLSAPENDERGPHPKGKKARARARAERNRQDEEPRFNIGPPRNSRNPANRAGRRGIFNRLPGQWYPDDSNVPDYPPPSFQEAITTPPVSVCSSTVSLVPQPTIPMLVIPEIISERPEAPTEPESLPTPSPENNSSGTAVSDDATDSDESIFIIDPHSVPVASSDIPKPPSRAKSDWLKIRSGDFLHKSSKELSTKPDQEATKIHRVRTINASSVLQLIDPDASNAKFNPPSPITSPKRKLMSLSPLKTMFPRSPVQEDRETLSALPSPSSSPYPTSRSVFFRSSTSLATASFLRLPLLSSTTSCKSEPLSRKLFKGKGRAKDRESIDAWEVLSEDAYEGVDSEGNETVGEPPSLMSTVGPFKGQAGSVAAGAQHPTSSIQIARILTGQQRADTQSADDKDAENSSLPHTPQEAAMKDWRSLSTLFLDRPVNRGRPAILAPGADIGSTTDLHASPMSSTPNLASLTPGPPLTTVRVRAKSPSPQPSPVRHPNQVIHLSPLRVDATRKSIGDQTETPTDMYQRALDTPLPLTPVYQDHFNESDLTPTQIPNMPTRSDSISAGAVSAGKLTPRTNPSTTTLLGPASVKEPMSPTRHHYMGRPLPRPPAPATNTRADVVDSIYASSESSGRSHVAEDRHGRSNSNCPEGLLIDLEDTSLDSMPHTGTSTPLPDEELFHSVSMSPASSSTADLLQLVDSPPFNLRHGLSSSPRPASPDARNDSRPHQRGDVPDITDLDVLVSRLADSEHNNGSDYETLLLVSEVLGPASPSFRTQSFPTDTSPRASLSDNTPLIGRIEVKRRRVLNDGRIKLKLTLLDVAVDKCGICLSQFRDADMAALTPVCQHSFHETCLQRWFSRSKTCSLCRVPLDTGVR